MYDPHTRESRGFGFVTMESSEEADAAITALNATDFMGKTVTVEKVMSSAIKILTVNLFHELGSAWTREDSHPWTVLWSSQAQ